MVDVLIQDTAKTRGGIRGALTTPEFRAYVDESNLFEEAVGTDTEQMTYRAEYGAEPFNVAAVTPNTFHFLVVPPLLGRTITKDDVQPGAPPVATPRFSMLLLSVFAGIGLVLVRSGVYGVMAPNASMCFAPL